VSYFWLHFILGTPLWDRFVHQDESKRLPFYKESPFSCFALLVCMHKQINLPSKMFNNISLPQPDSADEISDDENTPQSEVNHLYCIQFLKYLIEHIFPFGAMMNHSLLYLNDYSITDDTNAASESWNNVIC